KQNGRCHHCGLPMELGEDREIFFKVPKSKGGVEEVDNMAYVHSYCQRLFIESRSKE
ncbi:group II intron reverse transcriptase/maturase, partial [Streptococcus agalactiae]